MYMIEKIRYDRVEKRHRYVRDPEGYLFADGIYSTRIRAEDLPDWYVYGRYYKCFGYISAKDVKHMVYVPNKTFNHMFKDDMLYISYQEEISEVPNQSFQRYQGYDFYICGSTIVDFLMEAERYSGYDISTIKEQMLCILLAMLSASATGIKVRMSVTEYIIPNICSCVKTVIIECR